MTLIEAIGESQKKRDLFNQDTHVLKGNDDKYFSVITSNLEVFILNKTQVDKRIHYTAWNLKR